MERQCIIAVVSNDARVLGACTRVVDWLGGAREASDAAVPPALALVRSQAAAYFAGRSPIALQLVIGERVEVVRDRLGQAAPSALFGMCIVDTRAVLDAGHSPGAASPVFDALHDAAAASGATPRRSTYSDIALISADDYASEPYQSTPHYIVRVLPDEDCLLEAELLAHVMNYIQHVLENRLARRRLGSDEGRVTLGVHLAACMGARFGRQWVLSYYTGSIVSSLIKTLDALAAAAGAFIQRGPNEHALACASFVNWRLYHRGYLMVLTSAMVDELKGTLANLQQVGARGLIVCADAPESKWFGFQATIRSDADVRRVLESRRIPFVYLDDTNDTGRAIETVAELLTRHDGPVVLIATQAVLESRAPLATDPRIEVAAAPSTEGDLPGELARVLHILNEEPAHIVWQCGALTEEERELTLRIADAAGIALCDALSAPGFVPAFHDGRRVANYLGVLGQYGTNQEVFDFLNTDGKPNPLNEQWLFVVKGKLGQIDSPYSDADHERRFRICQVNRRRDHIGAFADIGIVAPAVDFLREVTAKLSVRPEVKRHREAKLSSRRRAPDVFAALPTLPMSPNYFFASLSRVVEALITAKGYRYTGIFDVGHAGTLGVRWLPRTGPSYSGWYGRGLMGDALQAAASLVTTSKGDVLAIVGDGAKQITADVVPWIVEALVRAARPIEKNVTIFFLVNNLYSIINSYQERIMFRSGGRQMDVMNSEAFAEHDASVVFGGTRVVRRRLLRFDEQAMTDALCARSHVNLFSVPVVGSNDGISIADQQNWQYAAPHLRRPQQP